ncbi:MAG: cadherin-like domain-containing protein [Gammaproteobacteria bacterium]|nr:cadherin-like domain-containing protein [Gammaproteobacteria bacterium]
MHYLVKSSLSVLLLSSLTACIFEDSNTEPVASSVSLGTNDGISTVVINNSQLLENVSDDKGSLSITDVSLVSGHGQLTQQNESWQYQPALNDLGTVSFSYTVSDGEFTDTASATLEIVNDNRLKLNETDGITIYSELNSQAHANLKVTLYVGNDSYEITTDTDDTSFSFINLPNGTGYLLEIDDLDDQYATMFYADIAESVDIPSSKNLNITQLTQPSVTTLNLINAATGTSIAGLEPYIYVNQFVDPDNGIPNIPAKKLYLEENNSEYSFYLDTNDTSVNVYLDELTDEDNVVYSILANDFELPVISTLNTGDTDNVYFNKAVDNNFTITVLLKAQDGASFNAGPLLSMFNRSTGTTEYWEKVAGTVNQYAKTLSAEQIIQSRVLIPIDNTDDGVIDYHAVTSSQGFPLFNPLSINDFDNRSLVVEQYVDATDYDAPLQAQLISEASNFQANGNTQVTFAFDRAISAPSTVKITTKVLTAARPQIDLNTTAAIYNAEKDTQVTTDQGETEIELEYDNTYNYTNKDGATVSVTLGTNGSTQTSSPYVTEYGSDEVTTALASNSYRREANNTLLTVSLSPSSIKALLSYEFEVVVDAPYDGFTSSTFSFELRAITSATTSLNDLVIDNFDFKDAATLDVTQANNEDYLEGLTPQTDTFFELNVGYDAGATNKRAQLSYLTRNINGLDDIGTLNSSAGLDSASNTLYLVSAAPVSGDVEITQQVEISDNAGSKESQTVALTDQSFILTLDSDNLTSSHVLGKTLYIAKHPENHGVDDSGLMDVFGVSIASGANVSAAGVYYVYEIPTSLQTSGRIEQVTLEFDVLIGGASVTGSKTYYVK